MLYLCSEQYSVINCGVCVCVCQKDGGKTCVDGQLDGAQEETFIGKKMVTKNSYTCNLQENRAGNWDPDVFDVF